MLPESGYRVVKGGWGRRPDEVFGLDQKRDLDLVARIRQVIGEDIDLVVDVLGARVGWDLTHATRMCRELEPYRLRWIEEPLPPHDLDAHARLRSRVATKIGTGEQEWNREGYRRLLNSGGVDVVQMDPGRCLGLTGCREVIHLVEAQGVTFSMHTWSSALNAAAGVHLLAVSSHGECMDFKPHPSPMQHELVSDPWVQKGGCLEVRQKPGLGVEVRDEALRKYALG